MAPHVIIVGADKGGVGKTTLSRLVMDYLAARAVGHRGFDTETPKGVLQRFYPAKVAMADLTDSDGQMAVFDTLGTDITVIDIRAGILMSTLQTLRDIGYLDPSRCRITALHVLGNSQASMSEVRGVTDAIPRCRYIAVANRINDTKFEFPAGSLDIPKLTERASESVDSLGLSFTAYLESGPSGVLRGYVNHWLGLVFTQFDAVKLAEHA